MVRLADDIYDGSTVPDRLRAALAAAYTPQEIMGLLLVVAQHHNEACLTNALALRTPEGLPTPPCDIK